MALVVVVVGLGSAAAWLRPSSRSDTDMGGRAWSLLAAGVILEVARLAAIGGDLWLPLFAASQLLLILFLVANRGVAGSLVISLGIALNALVIAANQGMPVSATASRLAGVRAPFGDAARHLLMNEASRLKVLGDLIPVPSFGQVLSPGDVLMLVGFAIASYMVTSAARHRRSEEGMDAMNVSGRPIRITGR